MFWTIALYTFLFWLLIYWWACQSFVIYMVHKHEDIKVGDFLIITLMCFLAGPFVLAKVWMEYAEVNGIFDKVFIKKCTKREVWQALGGKE